MVAFQLFLLKCIKNKEIIFYGKYFQDFYLKVNDQAKEKIGYVFRVIKSVDKVSEKFLKHIEGTEGLYEIRVQVGSNIYRIFCCFDKKNLVILFNAFQKKAQKTPKQEIELAERLKKKYFTLQARKNEKGRSN